MNLATIYNRVKTEYTEKHYLRKAQRYCKRHNLGKRFSFKPGVYLTEIEWQQVKKYLDRS